MVCPDGECGKEFQTTKPATEDFKKSIATLGTITAISKEMNNENLKIFNGKSRKCLKREKTRLFGVSIKKCCPNNNGGFLFDLGLMKCPSKVKILAKDLKLKKAIFVGRYSRKHDITMRYYNVYCTYPTKLARILVEQGRKQLSKGFGNARNPNCNGLTPDEIGNLNFDKIDLSGLYEDFYQKTNLNLPDVNEEIDKIKKRIQQKWSTRKTPTGGRR